MSCATRTHIPPIRLGASQGPASLWLVAFEVFVALSSSLGSEVLDQLFLECSGALGVVIPECPVCPVPASDSAVVQSATLTNRKKAISTSGPV